MEKRDTAGDANTDVSSMPSASTSTCLNSVGVKSLCNQSGIVCWDHNHLDTLVAMRSLDRVRGAARNTDEDTLSTLAGCLALKHASSKSHPVMLTAVDNSTVQRQSTRCLADRTTLDKPSCTWTTSFSSLYSIASVIYVSLGAERQLALIGFVY